MNKIDNRFRKLSVKLNLSEYWDFTLSDKIVEPYSIYDGLLISSIDTNNSEVFGNENGDLSSTSSVTWDECINNGLELNNIGYTAIDNGLILYDRCNITYDEFYEILTGTTLSINSGDCRVVLNKVSGNTQSITYPSEILTDENDTFIRLNGGFYQGFYKSNDTYQVLPTDIDSELTFEFKIRPKNLTEPQKCILNRINPQNKGIFFYIGARAENKFWEIYNKTFENTENSCAREFITDDEYIDDEYTSDGCPCNQQVELSDQETPLSARTYITSNGYDIFEQEYYTIKTDNKYLIFNQTETGFTTDTWHDGDVMEFIGAKHSVDGENLYTLMNQTSSGHTVNNINDYYKENQIDYDYYKDLYENAFALRVTDDGEIGYKYLIRDYESVNDCSVIEEYSKTNIVTYDEWNHIIVKIKTTDTSDNVLNKFRKMKLYFYVNGNLVFVSKSLPIFNFRKLNDVDDKQEGVPYNISVGGGTQGLIEKIWFNFRELPMYILPLEKYFAGTFIGDFKLFNIYNY